MTAKIAIFCLNYDYCPRKSRLALAHGRQTRAFLIYSDRVGGSLTVPRSLTPPYVRYRIRRFQEFFSTKSQGSVQFLSLDFVGPKPNLLSIH